MSMKVNEIIKLLAAGYSKEEIEAFEKAEESINALYIEGQGKLSKETENLLEDGE